MYVPLLTGVDLVTGRGSEERGGGGGGCGLGWLVIGCVVGWVD